MLTPESIEAFVAHLATNGSSNETLRAYRRDLLQAYHAVGIQPTWADLGRTLAQHLTDNRATWAPKTTQRHLGTLRSWGKWAGAPGLFLASYRPPKPAPPQPHPIPEGIDGVAAMIQSSRNPRHRALCALTGLMGLRVGEAVTIRPEHFNFTEMTLRVRGKGDKTRIVPLSDKAWKILQRAYALAVLNDTTLVRLSESGARRSITRHARRAGLSRHVKSHDMRATFATAAYSKSKDLRAVQELLGHADAKTTQVYTGVSMSQMRSASEVL